MGKRKRITWRVNDTAAGKQKTELSSKKIHSVLSRQKILNAEAG